jgi:hypothetical protein
MGMPDPALRMAVLRLLERWGRLPLSDVERLLSPLDRPRFRADLVREMQAEELIAVEWVGDEAVLALMPGGLARLGGRPSPAPPCPEVE